MTSPPRPGGRRASCGRLLRASAASVVAAALALPLGALPAAADDVRDREYWLESYGITEAWNITQGEGVKVAIIDSGIDSTHPDLAGAVTAGTDASGAGSPDGQRGIGEVPAHGTLVGTLLAGRGHQGLAPVLAPAATSSPAPGSTAEAVPGPGAITPETTAPGPVPDPSAPGGSTITITAGVRPAGTRTINTADSPDGLPSGTAQCVWQGFGRNSRGCTEGRTACRVGVDRRTDR